ncbi:arabinan endo-1 5-alpha-L-arabinosidase [Firmicutes bacterium CAG:449]|nr:arabinan endo-1 5-alpha-L-arabinosidase [Firmicutes bacterium CAG:449]
MKDDFYKKILSKITLSSIAIFSLFSCGNTTSNNSVQPSSLPITEVRVSYHNQYSNPTYPLANNEKKETYMADPFVVRDDDGTYYMYCTQTEVYTPNLLFKRGPTFKSTNMIDWTYVSDVFADYVPTWGESGAGVWAPTVIKIGDTWNFYYSLSIASDPNPGIGVATSQTPYGPWTHYGKLFNSNEIGVTNSIDPFVFVDDNNVYMAFGSYGGLISLVELTNDGLELKNGLEYQKENKVALAGFEVFDMTNYEGTFIFKKDGWYYLLLSTGSCCNGVNSTYKVVVSRSRNVKGPYLDSQGRDMFKPNRGDPVVVPSLSGAMGTGHCAVINDDNDNLWMLYHGYNTKGKNPSYRVLYLDQLIFDNETNMPCVENKKASNEEIKDGPYIKSLEE